MREPGAPADPPDAADPAGTTARDPAAPDDTLSDRLERDLSLLSSLATATGEARSKTTLAQRALDTVMSTTGADHGSIVLAEGGVGTMVAVKNVPRLSSTSRAMWLGRTRRRSGRSPRSASSSAVGRSPTARPGHPARGDRRRDPLVAPCRAASRGRTDRRAQPGLERRRHRAPLRSPGPARGDHDRPRSRERPARRGDRPAQRRYSHELGSIAQDRRAGPRRRVGPLARGAGRPILSAHQPGAWGVRDDLRPPGAATACPTNRPASSPSGHRSSGGSARIDPTSARRCCAGVRARGLSRRPGTRGRLHRGDRGGARGRHLGLCRHADPRRRGRGRWRVRLFRSPAHRAPNRPRGSRPRHLARVHGTRELPAAGTGDGDRRSVPSHVPWIARSDASLPAGRHARGRQRAGLTTVRRRTRVAARPATRGDRRVRRPACTVRTRRAAGRAIVQRQRNRDPSRWQSVPGGARDHPVAGGGGTTTAGPHPRPDGPAPPPGGDGRRAEDGGGRPPGAGSRSRAQQSASGDPRLQPAHPRRPVPAGRPPAQRGAAGGGSRADPGHCQQPAGLPDPPTARAALDVHPRPDRQRAHPAGRQPWLPAPSRSRSMSPTTSRRSSSIVASSSRCSST